MTIYGFIASIVWAVVVAYGIWRLGQILDNRFDPPEQDEIIAIPLDLQAFIARFASDWAKADAAKSIRERYAVSRDWNVVRRAVGLGTID
jgi:hypothetical protein